MKEYWLKVTRELYETAHRFEEANRLHRMEHTKLYRFSMNRAGSCPIARAGRELFGRHVGVGAHTMRLYDDDQQVVAAFEFDAIATYMINNFDFGVEWPFRGDETKVRLRPVPTWTDDRLLP